MFKQDLEKAEEQRDQIASIHWIIKKAREFQKNIYFCFIDYAKTSDYMDHNKLWKIVKKTRIPNHLTCLLRNLWAGQEVMVKTGLETTNWFKIGKEVHQGCILSPCLFNFYAEYIIRNAGLEETQAGIKIARRNINSLRYADDNIQPWRTPYPIWNQSVFPCPVLIVASWPAYRFLRRQVRWSGIPISFRIFHSLLWSTQSKALA